jgi:hypothetical protein
MIVHPWSVVEIIQSDEDTGLNQCDPPRGRAAMTEALSLGKLPFRVYFIFIDEPNSGSSVRMLLVASTNPQTIYEGFGTWSQFRRWVALLLGIGIPASELAAARKLLKQKQLATIKKAQLSLSDIESLGLSRVDGSS